MANRTPASSATGSRDKTAPSAHTTPSISFSSKGYAECMHTRRMSVKCI